MLLLPFQSTWLDFFILPQHSIWSSFASPQTAINMSFSKHRKQMDMKTGSSVTAFEAVQKPIHRTVAATHGLGNVQCPHPLLIQKGRNFPVIYRLLTSWNMIRPLNKPSQEVYGDMDVTLGEVATILCTRGRFFPHSRPDYRN